MIFDTLKILANVKVVDDDATDIPTEGIEYIFTYSEGDSRSRLPRVCKTCGG